MITISRVHEEEQDSTVSDDGEVDGDGDDVTSVSDCDEAPEKGVPFLNPSVPSAS